MTLNEITDTLLDKLKEVFPELEVSHYPDRPENYKFTHPTGAVLVILKDRRFQRGQATDGTGQVNEPVLSLSYFSRNTQHKGRNPDAYDLLDRGRKGLSGFCLDGGPLWCRRESLIRAGTGGVWIYTQEWVFDNYYDPEDE